jgi:hypothetical protein
MESFRCTRSNPRDRSIQRHGRYLDVDADGFIIKNLSVAGMQNEWACAADDMKTICVRHFGSALHSFYVRGSVAAGQAIPHVSDVDCMAALASPLSESVDLAKGVRDLCRLLQHRHPLASRFELASGSVERAMMNRPLQIVFQTQALCIYGDDLSDAFPRARVGRDASIAFRRLPSAVGDSMHAIEIQTCRDIRGMCAWIMRDVLRSAFELVMEREGKYTRDLYLCHESFSKHYPDREAEMYYLLNLAINPSPEPTVVMNALRGLDWLIAEITTVLGDPDSSTDSNQLP